MGQGKLQQGTVPRLLKEWSVVERRVYESCPQSVMVIFLLVLPSLEPQRSMASTTFIPSLTRPKTTCLPSNLQEKHRSQLAPAVPMWGCRHQAWHVTSPTGRVPGTPELALLQPLTHHSVLAVQMKNWEPFVLGPALAMDRMPGPVCFRMKFSSGNFSP